MKTSLSEISTVNATFAEDVTAYAAAGFDGIGIWESKLPADDGANVALLSAAGLAATHCVPAIPSILPLAIPGMEGPASPGERVAALCASVARFAAFAPACVVCLSGPRGDRSEPEARALVIAGLRSVATAARAAGVQLGFEPTHASERDVTGFVNSIGDAAAMLDEAGLDDVGVMVDTVHIGDTPTLEADIAAFGHRAAGFHISDKASAGAPDRLLPGEGVTNPQRVLELLRAASYDGYVDIEIFSTPDGFWGLPVDEAARRAFASISGLR